MAENDDQEDGKSVDEGAQSSDITAEESTQNPTDEEQSESNGFFDQKPANDSELSLENIQAKKSQLLALKSKHQKQIVIRKQLLVMLLLLVGALIYVVVKANPFKESSALLELQAELDDLTREGGDDSGNVDTGKSEDTGEVDIPDEKQENEVVQAPPIEAEEDEDVEEAMAPEPIANQTKIKKRRRRRPKKLSKSFVDPEVDIKKQLRARVVTFNAIVEKCELLVRSKDPSIRGRWEVSFNVYSSGSPTELNIVSKETANRRFENCVRKKIIRTNFKSIPNNEVFKRVIAVD